MKSFLVWLLSFTLLTSGMIFPNNSYAEGDETVVDESVFDIPTEEGDRAVEEMMAVVIPLCKDEKGHWKDEVIKLPLNDEDFNCSSLRKMEFDMLVEQDNPESEKRALLCATRDLDVQGRLEFARTLESLDALQLPLEEHFNCPGKKESMSDCVKDITCNAINMVLDQATLGVASWIAEKLTEQRGICPTTTQSNCFDELVYGVVKNIVSNIEGLLSLGKMALDGIVSGAKKGYNAVKNWIWGVEEPTRNQHHVLQEESDKGIIEWVEDAAKKVKETVMGFFSAMGTMIDEGIKDNFGCAERTESRYAAIYGGTPRCKEPVVSWGCATCSQRMNMSCGIVGYVGGEIVTAYLTGGALSMIKAGAKAGAASKLAQGIAKTKSFQTLAKGMSYAAKPVGATGKALVGVLRFSAKSAVSIMKFGRKWALKIGGRFLPISNASKVKILRMMVKGKNLAKKPFSAYMNAMERAFAAGYNGADGVRYLLRARKLASTGSSTRAGAELLDYATDSVKYNQLKGKLTQSNDEFNKLLLEYNKTIKSIKDLGPDEAARIAREQIKRLNQIKAEQKLLIADLGTEKKKIEAAVVAATNNVTDSGNVTLTANRVTNVDGPVVNGSGNTVRRTTQTTDGVAPRLVDNVPLGAGNLTDDAARTFKAGDHVDLYYKSGNNTKSAIIVGETDKQLIVRYAGEGPDVTHRINKVYLDMKKTFRYNNTGLVADDVIIPYKPTTDAISSANRQGALGDVVRLKYNNSANGMDGFITGRIAKETDDTIWIVNASNPEPGRRIRKVNLELTRTRNFFDTRHLNVTRNLQPEDAIAFTVNGKPISGEVVRLNQKSIRVKDKLGNIKTYELRKIDLGSISSSAIDTATGARIGATTATSLDVLDDVGQAATLTPALKAKYSALNEHIKPLVGKAQEVVLDIKGKAQQLGKILDQGTDYVVLRTAAGDKVIKYADILKLTVPARLILALDGEKPVLTNLAPTVKEDRTDVPLPPSTSGPVYDLTVTHSKDGDSLKCVAVVTKDSAVIDPALEANKETLKWSGNDRCLNKLECDGKISEGFNNIDVVLEIPGDTPKTITKKCSDQVSTPPVGDGKVYKLNLEEPKFDGTTLSCKVAPTVDGEAISFENQEVYKVTWSDATCSGLSCEGTPSSGFKDVKINLLVNGESKDEVVCNPPAAPSEEKWTIAVKSSATSNGVLFCQFVTKKGAAELSLPDPDKMKVEFSKPEKCKPEELSCTSALTELGDDKKFTATLKIEGEDDVSVDCKDESSPSSDDDGPDFEIDAKYTYDKENKKHKCKVELSVDNVELSASNISEKGYKLVWSNDSCSQDKFSCSLDRKDDEKDFNSIEIKVYSKDDSEESKVLAETTCENQDSEDIYRTDDPEEDNNRPRNGGPWHNYEDGVPIIPPQPTMLPPPMTYFHANFN
ncbi:MAG: hypothetical protein EP326_03495 [Deltaproteobacteria bacterium]|nr:MAG: hypothetical protein EP326_03495 [Deltaproteobacteria bacterium]